MTKWKVFLNNGRKILFCQNVSGISTLAARNTNAAISSASRNWSLDKTEHILGGT